MTADELVSEGYEAESCALCLEFDRSSFDPYIDAVFTGTVRCDGCPVREATGIWGCKMTPYYDAAESLERWCFDDKWYDTDQDNIEAEIRFLESLL